MWIRGPRRAVGVAGIVLVGAGALVGCRPGQLGPASVAYTTDNTATAQLTRQHVDVEWLTCGGDQSGGSGVVSAQSGTSVVTVDCQGETRDRRRITVNGEVTRAVDGACVRGDLRARVGGRQVFHVSGLGDCATAPGPTYRPPGYTPVRPRPTVTVTVTRTLWCQGDPLCWPVQGK